MKTDKNIFIEEPKGPKRIGWISYFKGDVTKLPNFETLFDLAKTSLKERYEALDAMGILEKRVAFENITPLVGFEVITKAQTGYLGTLAELSVNVHALGSGDNVPASSDTQLETEVTRKLINSRAYNGNKAYYTIVYGLLEGNGTHSEMGLFMGADDAVPNDGTIWDRSLVSIVKTSAQSLTIDYEDTYING